MGNNISEADAQTFLTNYILHGGNSGDEEDSDYEQLLENEEEEEEEEVISNRNPTPLDSDHLKQEIYRDTGCKQEFPLRNIYSMIQERELTNKFWNSRFRVNISHRFMPKENTGYVLKNLKYRGFCGQYSQDGKIFMTASDDQTIRLFDTRSWKVTKTVDTGLSIRDADYSPDQRWLIYSGWSSTIYLVNVVGEHEVHDGLKLNDQGTGYHFCLFSVKFSPNNDEIIGGSSDNSLYVYDLTRRDVTMRVEGHSNDVNTVCYLENGNNMILTAGDDCVIKLWDRRIMDNNTTRPVSNFVGHMAGLTHLSSKGDGRYFISNGKDQVIKLWDIRKTSKVTERDRSVLKNYNYMYGSNRNMGIHPNDASLMSYSSHTIRATLIRSYFTPKQTTGQKYIITGSGDGTVHIYDVLTGEVVRKLKGHTNLVRDVSCHPYEMNVVSTSWDTTLGYWNFGGEKRDFYPKNFTRSARNDFW